jgi:ribonucleoside-diphosphate reductase alpha chain
VTAPGQHRVIKRNGTLVPFHPSKVSVAITKAFLAVEGQAASQSSRIHEVVTKLTEQVNATFTRRMPSGGTIHIEEIQDQVELALMRSGEHKVAQAYVIYRAEHAREREQAMPAYLSSMPKMNITLVDGSTEVLDMARLNKVVEEACANLENVDSESIITEALKNLYDGVPTGEVNTALVMTARTMIEQEPNYTFVTSRLLLDKLRAESLSFFAGSKICNT